MKARKFFWIGLAVISAALYLVSWTFRAYAEESGTSGGPAFIHEDKKDGDHDNGGIRTHREDGSGTNPGTDVAGTDHRDISREGGDTRTYSGVGDHHTGDSVRIVIGTEGRDISRHDEDTDRNRRDRDHDNDDWAIEHHGSRGDDDDHDRGRVHRDTRDYYGYRIYGTGGMRDYTGYDNPYDRLGSVWYESEGAYTAVWTRRGDSNIFDAVWTNGVRRVTAVLTIAMDGDHVTIYRRYGSDGYDYEYTGILSGDETRVRGRVTGGGVTRADWEATITGYRR
jgi:hypothetical protein